MRQYLHRLLVGEEVFQVVENENADTLLGIGDLLQTRPQPFNDGTESMFLNKVKQLFFGFEVVVESCQRHAAAARQVAHGRSLVSLLIEFVGSVLQNLGQTAVEAGLGKSARCAGASRRSRRSWGGSGHSSNVRSNGNPK